ncbi:dTDP-4-dehydrorhamnose reductase [compost metagenome]|uniref:dTDP-4-dehydrorhamnose reductase n=1 Tax=Paenibacillus rhizolycopersici TaxID=2780073 RepID=A0ABS2H963_9BACL|nr:MULTISPECIES: SDR family oxidoreductase [Paenibacillus]MBM6997368.1 SDR family oxidoreductase [Paenibacillus rhizolycopersici]MUG86584.1 sugar nucleotide-binding protein [Paenibacillus timonensis]GIP49470.1 NAD(P)-dependent oxidoreductase [Paenibacillus sp. J53TS2]
MKMLILGGHGMAGHVLVRHFREQGGHQVFYTSRDPGDPGSLILDAGDIVAVDQAVQLVRPDVIINAVGVLNQFADQDKIMAYHINGFLPHRLRHLADKTGARLIHISTDCVFRGDRGGYREEDQPDGVTTYAVTKALGEVQDEGHLTIRTSIIGPEIRRQGIGLFQWFMSQEGKVSGYRRVKWNGVTTVQLAKTIEWLLDRPVSGLIHLAHPEVVSKYEMLHLFQEIWGKTDLEIEPDDGPALDRTLVNTRPEAAAPLPPFRQMLEEMADWMRRHG